MTDYSWTMGTSGDWSNAADWTGGVPNGSTADVTIAATGTYTVTIGVGEEFTVGGLTLDDAGATLLVAGGLTLDGPLTLTAGALDLNGTITGGTIVDPAGALVATGGTLSGVVYEGTLDMSGDFLRLSIENGLAMSGAASSGTGSILDTGYAAALLATGSGTITNAAIELGNDYAAAILGVSDATGAGVVLTLGAGTTVTQTGTFATLGAGFYSGDAINNQGSIDAGWTGGSFMIEGNGFTNAGTLSFADGTLDLAVYSLANSGSIAITGGTLDFDVTKFASTGTFTVARGAAIVIESNLTLAQLGTIAAAANTVTLAGMLDLEGGTLDVGTGTALGTVKLAGTIEGGTIDSSGEGVDALGGIFNDVTIRGTLLLGYDDVLTVMNGLSGAAAESAYGVINESGNVTINVEETQTFDDLTITSTDFTGSNLQIIPTGPLGSSIVLTFGSEVNIFVAGSTSLSIGIGTPGTELVNSGTIVVGDHSGQSAAFEIDTSVFLNSGSIPMLGDQNSTIDTSSFTNKGSLALDVGTLTLDTTDFSSTGSFTVASGATLDLTGTVTLAEIAEITLAPGTLEIGGMLDLGGTTFDVGTGTALGTVTLSGTLEDGIVGNGAGIDISGGTLDDMILKGALSVYANYTSFAIAGGLTGSGATIDTHGYAESIALEGTETLRGLTFTVSQYGFNFYAEGPSGVPTTVTFAADDLLNLSDGATWHGSTIGDRLVNLGTIDVGEYGASIDSFTFINAGTIEAESTFSIGFSNSHSKFSNSGSITIASAGTTIKVREFLNSGTITVDSGGGLTIDAKTFTDSGHLVFESGSSFGYFGDLTGAELIGLQLSGTKVQIDGAIDNTGQTITVGTGGTVLGLTFNGTIDGGVISDPDGKLVLSGDVTLSGVTYEGTLGHFKSGATLFISGGLTLMGAGGAGTALLDDQSSASKIYFTDAQTLSNVTIDIGAGSGDFLGIDDIAETGLSLTIASTTTIAENGNLQLGSVNNAAGDTIVNDGSINIGATKSSNLTASSPTFTNNGTVIVGVAKGSDMTVSSSEFTNNGIIELLYGSQLYLQSADFVNVSGGILTGGVYDIPYAGVISLNPDTNITTDDATIILGAYAIVESEDTATSSEVTIDTTLRTIAAGGVLELGNYRSWTGSVSFTNDGSLMLGGALTFTEKSLSNAAGGTISGSGTVATAIDNAGTIGASGGTLTLQQAITGTGALEIAAGGILNVAAAVASTQTVTFESGTGGSLALPDLTDFHAGIAGFTAGETIDLSGFTYAKTETISYTPNSGDTGGILRIVDGSLIAKLTLFGQYVTAGFGHGKDNGEGTDITYTPPAAEHPKLAAGR